MPRTLLPRRAVGAAVLAFALLVALAMTASAATQTTTDPDDPYEDNGFLVSSDLLGVNWDTESSPGKVVLKTTFDWAANARFGAYVFIDTNLDDVADHAVEISDYNYRAGGYDDQQSTRHGNLGEDGVARYAVRSVKSSSLDCQSSDDGNGPPGEFLGYASTVADNVGNDTTEVTIPIDLSALGLPASFRWAVATVSSKGPEGPYTYDFVPDAANGMRDDDGPIDPRKEQIFQDPSYCGTDGGGFGRRVRMGQGVLFTVAGGTPPEVTIDQSPAQARPGQTISFTANVKDDRAIASYEWDLDRDGEFDDATGRTASRAFPSGGRRFVAVRVTDAARRTGTGERTVDIADARPVVEVGQFPALARPGRPVQLTATASDDGRITAYDWDLDADGEFDDAGGASVLRAFATQRDHLVAVRVSDDGGNATTATRTVSVAERAPTLKLTTTKGNPNPREKFTLRANVADDGPIGDANVRWGFDLNGREDLDPFDKATGREWTLSFGWPGRYTMKARVTDDTGKVAEDRLTVEVPNVAPAFREFRIRSKRTPDDPFNKDPLLLDKPILLTAGFSDDNRLLPTVTWDLDGDGEFDDATGITVEHTYRSAGEKRIAAKLTDEGGLTTLADTSVEIRETSESECAGKVNVDGMRAVGCFRTEKDGTKATQEPMKLNGLDLLPRPGAKIRVDPLSGLVSTGDGTIQIKAGDTILYEGRFKMDPECDRTKTECLAFKTSVPAIAKLKGLPLKGEAEVYFTPVGTRVKVNVDIFGTLGVGFTARADLTVLDGKGLQLDDLEVRSPLIPLPKNLEIGQFFIKYEGKTRRWTGGGHIVLPTPQFTKLSGDFAFSEISGFERGRGEIDGLNLPVDPFGTIYLQRIAFTMEIKGSGSDLRVRLGGGLGASFGPRVGGVDAATVDGDFLFTFGWPLGIDVEGRVSVAGFDIFGASVGARTNGSVDMNGFIGFGLPFPKAQKGVRKDGTKLKVSKFDPNADVFNPFQIITVKGEASAWVEPDAFNLEASVAAKVVGINLLAAKGLMSSKGVAGCGEIIGIKGGFGYDWQTERTDLFGNSCDLSPWSPERKLAPLDDNGAGRVARQALDPVIDVPVGQKALMVKVNGAGGDPLVSLVAPDGTRYDTPGEMAQQRDDWFVTRHPQADETYVGVRAPAAGRWRVELLPGSVPISSVSRAAVLPTPKVKATVRSEGRARRIDYRIEPIPGQAVEFVEDGSDTHRTVGVTRGARGSLRFMPQDGAAGTRRLVAIVKQNGLPRAHVPVARFTAAAPPRPARPGAIRARRGAKRRVHVAWTAVPGAKRYRVIARMSDGRSFYVPTTKTSARVPGVERTDIVRVDVQAVDARMRESRPAVVRLARNQLRAPRRALAGGRTRSRPTPPRFTG